MAVRLAGTKPINDQTNLHVYRHVYGQACTQTCIVGGDCCLPLVSVVDAELLKRVPNELFKPEDVKDADETKRPFFLQATHTNDLHRPHILTTYC